MMLNGRIKIMEKDRVCKGCTHFEICPNHYFPDPFCSMCDTNRRKADRLNMYDKPIDKSCVYTESEYEDLIENLTRLENEDEDSNDCSCEKLWDLDEIRGDIEIIDPKWKAYNPYTIQKMSGYVLGLALDIACDRDDLVFTIVDVFRVEPDKANNRNRFYKTMGGKEVEFNIICWRELPKQADIIRFTSVPLYVPKANKSE